MKILDIILIEDEEIFCPQEAVKMLTIIQYDKEL